MNSTRVAGDLLGIRTTFFNLSVQCTSCRGAFHHFDNWRHASKETFLRISEVDSWLTLIAVASGLCTEEGNSLVSLANLRGNRDLGPLPRLVLMGRSWLLPPSDLYG